MVPIDPKERRRAKRRIVDTECFALFLHGGKSFHMVMENVSELGARFRARERDEEINYHINDELELYITTALGSTLATGRVVWMDKRDGYYIWGYEFKEVDMEKKSPLRRILDAIDLEE